MFKIAVLLSAYMFSWSASAYQVRVSERVYRPSCSYFTNITGDYRVMIKTNQVKTGERLSMEYGWQGMDGDKKIGWKYPASIRPERKIGDVYVFSFSRALVNRGSSLRLNSFQFRFKISRKKGEPTYLTGSSNLGSMFKIVSKLSSTPCIKGDQLPKWQRGVVILKMPFRR